MSLQQSPSFSPRKIGETEKFTSLLIRADICSKAHFNAKVQLTPLQKASVCEMLSKRKNIFKPHTAFLRKTKTFSVLPARGTL